MIMENRIVVGHRCLRWAPRLIVALATAWALHAGIESVASAQPAATAQPARAAAADVASAKARLAALGSEAKHKVDDAGRLTEISIEDGADISADDVALFGRLLDLRSLKILNCRALNDAMVKQLAGLSGLDTLALTNSAITDEGVATLVQAFPSLVELDLSSNTNMTGAALKLIASLTKLERLTLLQNRFNDLNTRRLARLPELKSLDLRGNMEAGDMTLEVIGKLPKLTGLKHRSSAVTDDGLAGLAESGTLQMSITSSSRADARCRSPSSPRLASSCR